MAPSLRVLFGFFNSFFCRSRYILYSILTFIIQASCDTKFHLVCEYSIQDWTPAIGELYVCNVTNEVIIKERYVKEGTVSGIHNSEKTDKDVQGINAYFKSINYIPDFSVVFKNLIGLHLDMCKVLKLTKEELKPYPKLQQLFLHRNKLRILEKDLFEFNPDLKYIRISHNMLREIDPMTFANLKALTHVYLSGNECTQKDAETQKEIQDMPGTLQSTCVITYRPAPVTRRREERKRVVKEKTSIWKTFGVTFGTFGACLVAAGIFQFFKKIFTR